MLGKTNLDRTAVLVAVGVIGAWTFLGFWRGSAGEPWSSDPWLVNTAMGIAIAGPIALLSLAILSWRQRKRFSHHLNYPFPSINT
jgi:hypothetical protein